MAEDISNSVDPRTDLGTKLARVARLVTTPYVATVPDDPPVAGGLVFLRPVEADHARIVAVIDEWWGGRKLRHLLPRLWLQHFTGTSWVVDDAGGVPVAFLPHGKPERILANLGLDADGIARSVRAAVADLP